MLALMFSNPDQGMPPYVPPIQKTENGDYFLDENPDYFKVVLDFLRNGKVNWKDEKFSFDGVHDLATSFKLDELIEELSTVVLNLNGVKEIRISKKFLKRIPESKMAIYFSNPKADLACDQIFKDVPRTISCMGGNHYFIGRPMHISELVFKFMSETGTSDHFYTYKHFALLTKELEFYGIFGPKTHQFNKNNKEAHYHREALSHEAGGFKWIKEMI